MAKGMSQLISEKVGNEYYNFSGYLLRYKNFCLEKLPKLVEYWKGNSSMIESDIIIEFNYLYQEYDNMIFAYELKLNSKTVDLDFFEISEFLGNIKMFLDYIKNLPKYLKTSINFVDIFEQPVVDYFVKQGDTLESIAKEFYDDPEFYEYIMDYNGLNYYDVDSATWIGKKIKIPAKRIITKDVYGIVDGLVGKNVLGKDIDSSFHFDSEDIAVLIEEECFKKALEDILMEIPKGTVPEFPNVGNNVADILGKDAGLLKYNMIIRDLIKAVKHEPALDEINITNVGIKEDALFIDFEFTSVLGTTQRLTYSV